MNPGDPDRTVRDIVKVVAGDCEKLQINFADYIQKLYRRNSPFRFNSDR